MKEFFSLKLIDRYVLWLFLKNYVISLTVLIGLYVVMDMVFEFDKIVTVEKTTGEGGLMTAIATIKDVFDYYFYQSFNIFVQMSGIIPVVAAAFTLMRLSRFNELTAVVAAGVPILWVARWVFFAAAALNVLLIVDQEYVLPQMISKITRKHDEMHASASNNEFTIKSMQVGESSLLVSALYHIGTATTPDYMEDVDIIDREPAPTYACIDKIRADRADWDPVTRRWKLTNGRLIRNLQPRQTPSNETSIDWYGGDLTPDEISLYHGSESVDLLSTRRINELLDRPKSYGAAGLYKIKHLRISQPIMNMVLLALTIPAVLSYDPKSLKSAASRCLVLLGIAMGLVFFCQMLATKPPLGAQWQSAWPALMAWLPIFIFAPFAAWLLANRVRT
jgi:lipopolysaccharide export system permease protein